MGEDEERDREGTQAVYFEWQWNIGVENLEG